ncbi:hypothetical protein COOONC_14721 [Cooperia oncophora]
MLHWVQMAQTGITARLDLGEQKNLATYGEKTPRLYDFRNISKVPPTYLFTGGNDWIADDDDTTDYLLPQIGSILRLNTHLANYNHFVFT